MTLNQLYRESTVFLLVIGNSKSSLYYMEHPNLFRLSSLVRMISVTGNDLCQRDW